MAAHLPHFVTPNLVETEYITCILVRAKQNQRDFLQPPEVMYAIVK